MISYDTHSGWSCMMEEEEEENWKSKNRWNEILKFIVWWASIKIIFSSHAMWMMMIIGMSLCVCEP